MATSRKTGLRHADLPGIDRARFPDNQSATRFAEQVRQTLETRFGKAGQKIDRAVTWGDLVESGIVSMRGPKGQIIRVDDPGGDFIPTTPPEVDGIPPAPTGLHVTPGLATIILEWDQPTFAYFGYAEIWRSSTDNLGDAVRVGQTLAWIYADPMDASATFYYWIRFISTGGKPGPFNSVGGVSGTTSLDPTYLIDVLSSDNPNALLYEIPEPTVINGVPVPAGIYMRDLYVANGSMTNLKLANGAVDTLKVSSLSAEKITFGEMHGDRIEANTLDADRITVETLAARLAVITTAYVGTANIENAAITDAKVANLNAAKLTAGFLSADRLAASSITAGKLNVSTLSAITATIGVLRTATSGSRLEIRDNLLLVYDSSNVLRVRLGIW
ncbi:hypothetical protein RE432_14780 [Pusillimonas sp. SM2304]|uniref:hypothetical protein n=1 Tax=Pusillimonas sp. SM2304 TaxID=3073241 RepID=UPI0028767800|nr:hypothetical protein [Pusillimonas sp. SM2304]MDS1141704.1 hypothetical protein [Pusillimonas sp. SM2304]